MNTEFGKTSLLKGEMNFLGRCPACKAVFCAEKATILQKDAQQTLFHIDCVSCKSSSLITLSIGPMHLLTSIIVLTDLHKSDIVSLSKAHAVTSDDVLVLHKYLKSSQSK